MQSKNRISTIGVIVALGTASVFYGTTEIGIGFYNSLKRMLDKPAEQVQLENYEEALKIIQKGSSGRITQRALIDLVPIDEKQNLQRLVESTEKNITTLEQNDNIAKYQKGLQSYSSAVDPHFMRGVPAVVIPVSSVSIGIPIYYLFRRRKLQTAN